MGIFKKIIKTTLTIAETPIAIVKDVATLGGTLTDNERSYTARKLDDLADDYYKLKRELDN